MSTIYCTHCAAPAVAGSAFCAQCGQALGAGLAVMPGQAVEAIKPRLRTSIPAFVRRQLRPDEQVLAAFSASLFDHHRKHEIRHDKVLLTTERIITYRTALVHKSMSELPYNMVTGVVYNRGLVHGKLVVEAANFGLTLSRLGNDDAVLAERIIAGSVAGRRYRAS